MIPMAERLVAYIEPHLLMRVVWGSVAIAIGLALLVRLLIGNSPLLVLAAYLFTLVAASLFARRWLRSGLVTRRERVRRFLAAVPYWERVILRALIFAPVVAAMQVDRVSTAQGWGAVILICVVGGVAFGVTQEWISQWAMRRAGWHAG
jgi:hypothetical protein